jgi:hypothetical protein
MFSPDASITGATQSAFTTPTYTLAADLAPDVNSRQYVVTALGGTQTDVRASTAGDPFTLTVKKTPYKAIPVRNPVNGSYGNVPLNRVELLFRKGMQIDSLDTLRTGNLRIITEIPAGAESNDPANIKALLCFAIGLLVEESQDIADSQIAGVW